MHSFTLTCSRRFSLPSITFHHGMVIDKEISPSAEIWWRGNFFTIHVEITPLSQMVASALKGDESNVPWSLFETQTKFHF